MNTNTTYNGWTNQQTWNVGLNYGEIFSNMAEEQEFDDVEHLAEAFEQIVFELELENGKLSENSMAYSIVNTYLNEVDWTELAEHYAADFELFTEEDEEEDEEEAVSAE